MCSCGILSQDEEKTIKKIKFKMAVLSISSFKSLRIKGRWKEMMLKNSL